ncbi:hypothetical protein GCM10009547_25890 [Sporichthya brevicatena]|uniref:DUF559 domain-containing protein n=1 Tax=Sporichthya brevicatena TaxID=171442 RepID=A0ABN1GWL6_9ACTN
MSHTRADRIARRAAIEAVASRQGNLIGRRQLYALGVTRSEVRAEIVARRWRRRGCQCIQVGDAGDATPYWRAVLEVGPTAVVDGVSALIFAGLRTISSAEIHIAVPQGAWYRRCKGVRVHETRRFREVDVVRGGLPRTAPATAAVHGALWARTDNEAALFVIASVQQGLVAVPQLVDAVALIKRDKRRKLLKGLLIDVSDGIESIDERAFAKVCRDRGIPKPDRQVVARLPSGRVRYDNYWGDVLVVEIHGAQHLDVAMTTRDMLKLNAASMDGRAVIQIPNFAIRTNPDPFLDQIESVLAARAYKPPQRQRKRAS